MYSKYILYSICTYNIFAVQCIYLSPTLFFKLNNALRFWRFLQLVMLKTFFSSMARVEMAKDIHLKVWNFCHLQMRKFYGLATYRPADPYVMSPWNSFDSSCPFLNDKYTKFLFNATFSSGKKLCLLKPYLFTQPNPTYGIISWTISWQTITIFLSCMVWFAN